MEPPIEKMIGSQSNLTVWAVIWVLCVIRKSLLQRQFLKKQQISKRGIIKNFKRALNKVNLHFKLLADARPWIFHKTVQLDISWTLKMFNRKYNLFVRSPDSLGTFLSTTCQQFFLKWINFQTWYCKKVYCPFNEISLHLEAAC